MNQSKHNTVGAEIDDFLDHLVFKEGRGPNGSGGEIRYWKGGKDITAKKALTSLLNRATVEAREKLALGITKELKKFTAKHDQPMRDEAIEIVKEQLQQGEQ